MTARLRRWRKRFQGGRSPGRAWTRVAGRVGARPAPGSSEKDPALILDVDPWRLRVEKQVVSEGEARSVYTRARALFRAPHEFRLRVLPRKLLHRVAEALGVRRVTLGRKDFDGAFTVRSSGLGRARSLLARGRVVAPLVAHPRWSVEVKPASRKERRRLGSDVSTMTVHRRGLVTEEAELEALVRLARELMEELGRLGIASLRPVEEDT